MSSIPKSYPVRQINAWDLRRLFNKLQLYPKVEAGELTATVRKDGHPSRPLANEPFCTRSQLVYYYNSDGDQIAIVHQYLRTDGTLGLSGKPDPKSVLHDGISYISDEWGG